MLATESTTSPMRNTAVQGARPSAITSTSEALPIVFVIGSTAKAREAIGRLVRSAGWQPESVSSAEEFLSYPQSLAPCCALLDHAPPELDALELQKQVASERPCVPIIFVTECADVRVAVQAMQGGALEFLTKPPSERALTEAIAKALECSAAALHQLGRLDELRRRYESLSRREREVMEGVVDGRLNKQVGSDLDISEITVKAHRGSAMRKMKARSLPALVMMAAHLGIGRPSRGEAF